MKVEILLYPLLNITSTKFVQKLLDITEVTKYYGTNIYSTGSDNGVFKPGFQPLILFWSL